LIEPIRFWTTWQIENQISKIKNCLSLRFPKSARLTRTGEFQKLKREGVSFHGKFMVLSVLKVQPATSCARVGLITSRRVGNAVARNRVRRRLREMVRADRPRLAGGLWFALIVRQSALKVGFIQLRDEWRALATRAALFAPGS
jgi:ribonuclease P protein component